MSEQKVTEPQICARSVTLGYGGGDRRQRGSVGEQYVLHSIDDAPFAWR